MDSRAMAALLSTLVSQLTLLIILLFPSDSLSDSLSHSFETLSSLIHNFLSSSETAVSLSLLTLSRKRRRTHFLESDSDHENPTPESKLARLSRVDPFLVNPDSFRVFFKMAPSTFEWLSGLLEPLLECRDPVGSPLNLSAELRLGIGLTRLATGSGYDEIASRFRVTEQVAKFCSKQLCRVLCTNFRFWVGFPNSDEFDSVSNNFENLTGLPNCCGVIGCTKFNFITTDNKQDSISAQMVVDSSCRILSIFAGLHGDKGNIRVLKSSTLYRDIEGRNLLNSPPINVEGVGVPQYLIGEYGYPLLPWLMVPYDDPKEGSNEEKFNGCLGTMRISMHKTLASLKNWGILSKPVVEEFRNVVAYVGACAILHNALLLREDYTSLCDCVEDYKAHDHIRDDYNNMQEKSMRGSSIRNALATRAKDLCRKNKW